jgi:threonine/homoserine/homoserine lactone efflux protein
MGLGGMVFATAALLGLHVILTSAPSIYLALKIIGAIYLIYLATRLWKGASAPLETPGLIRDRLVSQRKSLILGFVTQLSNPKTAIVYASIFTALVPEIPSAGLPRLCWVWYLLLRPDGTRSLRSHFHQTLHAFAIFSPGSGSIALPAA